MSRDFFELVKSRRSVRRYADERVPQEVLDRIIDAARWAPSPNNRQGWGFVVVRNDQVKKAMVDAVFAALDERAGKLEDKADREDFLNYGRFFTFFSRAPVVLVVTYQPRTSFEEMMIARQLAGLRGDEKSTYLSALAEISGCAAAVQNILLAAHALGYGGCWMTGPLIAEDKLALTLALAPGERIGAVIPIGKPLKESQPPRRRDLHEMVRYID